MSLAFERLKVRGAVVGIASVVAFAGVFAACAQGTSVDPGPGGESGGGGEAGTGGDAAAGDASKDSKDGPAAGTFGAPCTIGTDCSSGQCTQIGQGSGAAKVCTQKCAPGQACPGTGYCEYLPNDGYTCVPDRGSLCGICSADTDCKDLGDKCAASALGDPFCARDCSFDSECPSGFTCQAITSTADGGTADGGTKDGGTKDASVDGAKDSGGSDGSAKLADKYCFPANDQSCPCNAQRDGVKHECQKTVGGLSCVGHQSCDGKTSSWSACDAKDPSPEVCDGVDNDCSGKIDDAPAGTPNVGDYVCKASGAPPPNAHWGCVSGTCKLGACDAGFTNFPPGLPASAGCPCAIDPGEPNDQCVLATSAGSINDTSAQPLLISGTLSSLVDVDWYGFDTVNVPGASTNTYHVAIHFTSNPNDEYLFDVVRGASCPGSPHTGLIDYDWCVDFQSGGLGEQTCAANSASVNQCGDHSSHYLLRVSRKAGAGPTCSPYQISVQASGASSTPCGASDACDPQTP